MDVGAPRFDLLTVWLVRGIKATQVPARGNTLLPADHVGGLHTCEKPLEQFAILGSGDLVELVAVTDEERSAEV